MSFFVAPNDKVMDLVTDNMLSDPNMADRYDAIADLREISRQDLIPSVDDSARANGFYRVASLQGPLEHLARVLEPDFLKEKRRFYRWLDAHPQHATYDRRRTNAVSKQLTIMDGKVVT